MNASQETAVEKLVYGGGGLSRVDGQVVLTSFVLPGETVRIEIDGGRSGVRNGILRDVLAPSGHRVAPPCPYFKVCGGCHYQHADYAYQLEQKRAVFSEALRRIGKFEPPEEIAIVAGPEWRYRNRTQFHLANGSIGFLQTRSHQLVPVDDCPISSPKINEALGVLREMMREGRFPRFVESIELFTNEVEVQLNVLATKRPVARSFFEWCGERIPGAEAGALEYDGFRVSHGSFFQANRHLAGQLVEAALQGAEGETAFDLYAGVGLFSVPLAQSFRAVTAVESGSSAVRDLEFNAARTGVSIDARKSDVSGFLAGVEQAPDFILADPPRAGLGKQAVSHLLRLKPRLLTIVSCDPPTLARDLAALLAGGYRIGRCTMIDLFPQTYHIESVVQLELAR